MRLSVVLVEVVGLVAIMVGVGLIYLPAALIIGGAILVAIAFALEFRGGGAPRRRERR